MPVRSRLLEPSSHALLRLRLRQRTTLLDGMFSLGNSAEYLELSLKIVVGFHVDQIGGRLAVLGNQDRRFFILQFGENFGGPALQCGYQFRAH